MASKPLGDELAHEVAIAEVALDDLELCVAPVGCGVLPRCSSLARRVVIVVEIVEARHAVAALQARRPRCGCR